MTRRGAVCLLFVVVCSVMLGLTTTSHATFPGENGRIAFWKARGFPERYEVFTMNPDGSAVQQVGPESPRRWNPAWSPDGQKLAYLRGGAITIANQYGTGEVALESGGEEPSWSPDGSRIAFFASGGVYDENRILTISVSGGPPAEVLTGRVTDPAWSPGGSRIAFARDTYPHGQDIWVVNVDGTDPVNLTNDSTGNEFEPNWSPDGSRIAYTRGDFGEGMCCASNHDTRIEALDVRTGVRSLLIDLPGMEDGQAAWSPDGTRLVFSNGYRGQIVVARSDGTNPVVLGTGSHPDWQPIPVNSYPRPRVANAHEVTLVPAYSPCTSPNRTHGPPLVADSCNPPAMTSDEATVGTADSNGRPTKGTGLVRYAVLAGDPATPTDEADLQIFFELRDVYDGATLHDYTGELRLRTDIQITDKLNTPHPGGPGAGTVSGTTLSTTVPCATTSDQTTGSSCYLITTLDALVPGIVPERKRSVWELGRVEVDDGGADGDADTLSDNTLLMVQGVFIP